MPWTEADEVAANISADLLTIYTLDDALSHVPPADEVGYQVRDNMAEALLNRARAFRALQGERDEQWQRANVLAQQNAYHKDRAEAAEARVAELEKALNEAADALDAAMEDVEHWGGYASEYFRDKHDLDGDLSRISEQATAARRALEGGKTNGRRDLRRLSGPGA